MGKESKAATPWPTWSLVVVEKKLASENLVKVRLRMEMPKRPALMLCIARVSECYVYVCLPLKKRRTVSSHGPVATAIYESPGYVVSDNLSMYLKTSSLGVINVLCNSTKFG